MGCAFPCCPESPKRRRGFHLDLRKEMRDEFMRSNEEAQVAFVIFRKDDFKKRSLPRRPTCAHTSTRTKTSTASRSSAGPVPFHPRRRGRGDHDRKRSGDPERMGAGVAPGNRYGQSHLFKLEDPAKESEVRARAEETLKRAQAGADFADLARKTSEDEGSAKNGGDLGAFTRDQMVKEFSDAAFALKPGEISGLVRTQYGYHIIKAVRHDVPTLEASRDEIAQKIRNDKAGEIVSRGPRKRSACRELRRIWIDFQNSECDL